MLFSSLPRKFFWKVMVDGLWLNQTETSSWKRESTMSNVVDWTSTAWSILQGRKIINVLCCRILLFMVSQYWRRRNVCLKSLIPKWHTTVIFNTMHSCRLTLAFATSICEPTVFIKWHKHSISSDISAMVARFFLSRS